MTGWQFVLFNEGWTWQRLDDCGQQAERSARAFANLAECLEDAKQRGYSFDLPTGVAVRH